MSERPEYFERIRLKASQRWDQLEGDPELAGPWHQLFKQVQSPRHVLSELLQNADDAGARRASVRIDGEDFIFEHDGEDFTEEHFASLCRFGYSNKRALHTIGFRGVGFKSTFSLGDVVKLSSPTLSVKFNRRRFSEPHWDPAVEQRQGTQVRVAISDKNRLDELKKNLAEWKESPVSLLFFRNLRSLRIGDHELHWTDARKGPAPGSQWVTLEGHGLDVLHIMSSEEEFPTEALDEIRGERLLSADDETVFPPCRVELVLGAEGRLYVVLPTGVRTDLPFACNAPFIQDPSRMFIKDPSTSPTNRWLLNRLGELAGSTLFYWLDNRELSIAERARSYQLLPELSPNNDLEGTCGTLVEQSLERTLGNSRVLLAENGELQPKGKCIACPEELIDIWGADKVQELLDDEGRRPLSRDVSVSKRDALIAREWVEDFDRSAMTRVLRQKKLPQPSWAGLLSLWAFVAPVFSLVWGSKDVGELNLVPVQGKDELWPASDVVRLGKSRLLQSDEDWEFLAKYLVVSNQNWTRFLADQRLKATESQDHQLMKTVELAHQLLAKVGLEDTSDTSKMINGVAAAFFDQAPDIEDAVRLAQIAAKLDATLGDEFHFVNRDGKLTSIASELYYDGQGFIEELLPEHQRTEHLLHQAYVDNFRSCTKEEWESWVESGKAGLLTVPPIREELLRFNTSWSFLKHLNQKAGYPWEPSFPYTSDKKYQYQVYELDDFDFSKELVMYWQDLPSEVQVWPQLARMLLRAPESVYRSKEQIGGRQSTSSGGRKSRIWLKPWPAAWLRRLSQMPCLPDTRGTYRRPGELLRRTPQTESLLDVELFVDGHLDTERNRPLLDLLGVSSTPTGPDRVLDCLRTLAQSPNPPAFEVDKWYDRLDKLMDYCSTVDLENVKRAFRDEKLILASDGAWVASTMVFVGSDEAELPDAAVVRPSVSGLALWSKIGVAAEPTADLLIEWLSTLPSGEVLAPDDLKRVRTVLGRFPVRIWEECEHWLNLANEWVPVADLSYSLSMQSLIPWSHLHPWVKQNTADLQRLSAETAAQRPFSDLYLLSSQVEERFQSTPIAYGKAQQKEWMLALGEELSRAVFESEDETERVRVLAERLSVTNWIDSYNLLLVPYIEGTPAGTARRVEVKWVEDGLYVSKLPKGKLAKFVPEEIGSVFARDDIKMALQYAVDRSQQDVRDYMAENFRLVEPVQSVADVENIEGHGEATNPLEIAVREGIPQRGSTNEGEHGDDSEFTERDIDDEPKEESVAVVLEPEAGADEQEQQQEGEDEEEGEEDSAADEPGEGGSRAPRRERVNILEQFATNQGFIAVGDHRFVRGDGSWIVRSPGPRNAWEHHGPNGDLVRTYYPMRQCLERQPLELSAEMWSALDLRPELYALILEDLEGEPKETTGQMLKDMRANGSLTLYPAAYRLVHGS